MRFLGSNATEMRWWPEHCPGPLSGGLYSAPYPLPGSILGGQFAARNGKDGRKWVGEARGRKKSEERGGRRGGISCIQVLSSWELCCYYAVHLYWNGLLPLTAVVPMVPLFCILWQLGISCLQRQPYGTNFLPTWHFTTTLEKQSNSKGSLDVMNSDRLFWQTSEIFLYVISTMIVVANSLDYIFLCVSSCIFKWPRCRLL